MKKRTNPPPPEGIARSSDSMLAMNEALVLGSLRQHELTASAVALNARLEIEITDRKLVELGLRRSELRYRRMFETANDGVFILDPETCRITDANPFVIRLLGYPLEQLIGKELFEIGLLKDEAASREMFENLKRDHEVRYEDLPLETRSGERQEVEVVANLYMANGHHVIQCNVRDITVRKRAEDILQRNEALFTALIDLAPVGVFVVDAKFRLQQVNPNAMHVFKDVHPLIGRDLAEILHILWPNPSAAEVIALFRHTLETGEPYQSPEFIERRKDTGVDEIYEYETQSVTLPDGEKGLVCFFNNITERKNAEAARRSLDVLTASNAKLKKEIVRRKAVEESLQRNQQLQIVLLEKSRQQEESLRNMSRRIMDAQEAERKRISRELHDVISQNLIGINVSMDALSKGDPGAFPKTFRRKINETQRIVENAVDRIHHFCHELRPAMLDDLGLIPALETLLERFMTETGIRSSLTAFAGIEEAESEILTTLYRVTQEALANVARHSHADHVAVSITSADGCITMEIQDDGCGFDEAAPAKLDRLGLLGMKERVEMSGGCFEIESPQGQGTLVRARFTKPIP